MRAQDPTTGPPGVLLTLIIVTNYLSISSLNLNDQLQLSQSFIVIALQQLFEKVLSCYLKAQTW